jgi:hypothetical protein
LNVYMSRMSRNTNCRPSPHVDQKGAMGDELLAHD